MNVWTLAYIGAVGLVILLGVLSYLFNQTTWGFILSVTLMGGFYTLYTSWTIKRLYRGGEVRK